MKRWKKRKVAPVQHFGCHTHPTEPHVASCGRCDQNVCETCRLDVNGTTYCLRCAMHMAGVSRRRR